MKMHKGWYFPKSEKKFVEYFDQLNTNEYQLDQRKESFKYLDNNRKAIDIGANVGLWAKDICKTFKEVKLFEPYIENIECLRKNLEFHDNFEIFECALSNIQGFANLYIDKVGLGNNSLSSLDQGDLKIKIKTMKLDDYNFEDIDYIKIDVQYHELQVIEGSINTLKKNSPVLCIEAARRNKSELIYVNKFVKILGELNYKVVGEMGKELFFKK